MSKESERLYKEIEKYLTENSFKNEEEAQDAIEKLIDKKNSEIGKPRKKDAWDYLDMAYNAKTNKTALKYATKAAEMDKGCLDAKAYIAELSTDGTDELKKEYEKLIHNTQNYLKREEIVGDDDIGRYWGIIGTRPYMRLRSKYVGLLIEQGKIKKAIKECLDLLRLSEHDNLGVRYLLISLYASLENEKEVLNIYERYEKGKSTHTLLPIIALYYKLDRYSEAKKYLKKLYEVNKNTKELFLELEKDDSHIFEEIDMYSFGSREEILNAITESYFLYMVIPDFFAWIAKQ